MASLVERGLIPREVLAECNPDHWWVIVYYRVRGDTQEKRAYGPYDEARAYRLRNFIEQMYSSEWSQQ